jgi:hypothetical protein
VLPSIAFIRHDSKNKYFHARIEYSKMSQCKDPDLDIYLEDMNMKQARVIDAESMIEKWKMKICELGEKDYTSLLPNANLNDSRILNELTNLAITPAMYSYTENNDNEEDGNEGEQDFSTAPSIEQINDIVDNIHQEDD